MFNKLIIFLNKTRGIFRRSRVLPEDVLIVLPHCLQNHDCTRNIVADIANCVKCGKCKIAEFTRIHEDLCIPVVVVKGGQQACLSAGKDSVKVVIAVACEKELAAGIVALIHKKIYAIPNIIRTEPCIDTDVDMPRVHEMIKKVVNLDGQSADEG